MDYNKLTINQLSGIMESLSKQYAYSHSNKVLKLWRYVHKIWKSKTILYIN